MPAKIKPLQLLGPRTALGSALAAMALVLAIDGAFLSVRSTGLGRGKTPPGLTALAGLARPLSSEVKTSSPSIVRRQQLQTRRLIYAAAIDPSGTLVVGGGLGGHLTLWDSASSEPLLSAPVHHDAIEAVVLCPDRQWLALGSWDNRISLWDVQQQQQTGELVGHQDDVKALTASPNGVLLASGSFDRTVKLWHRPTGTLQHTLPHDYGVTAVAFSPDGHTLVSADRRGHIYFWDVASGQKQVSMQGHRRTVWDLAISADGRWLASASQDKTIQLWDMATKVRHRHLQGHQRSVHTVAFSPDSQQLVSGGYGGELRLWSVADAVLLAQQQAHTGAIWAVDFAADGTTLVSGGTDGTLALWTLQP